MVSRTPRAEQVRGRLAYGCAGLFGLPSRSERRNVLAAAYELGIRQFDVAPIYGLGAAESELGDFLRGRDGATVTTKFGLDLTHLGRAAGVLQSPVRWSLRRSGAFKTRVKASGEGPAAGVVGRALYRTPDYSLERAKVGLERSCDRLKRDVIDDFLLHEPSSSDVAETSGLADFLDEQRQIGRIGRWGLAGDLAGLDRGSAAIARAQTVQTRYDIATGLHPVPGTIAQQRSIIFGFLSGGLAPCASALRDADAARHQLVDVLGVGSIDSGVLAPLLLQDALIRNPGSTVIVSSTSVKHLAALIEAAESPSSAQHEALSLLTASLQQAGERV